MISPKNSKTDAGVTQSPRPETAADDLKLAPDFSPPVVASNSRSVRAWALAGVATVVVLGVVGWLRVRQRPSDSASRALAPQFVAGAARPLESFAWVPAYRSAVALDRDFDGALVVLARQFAELQRYVRTSKTVVPDDVAELAELEVALRTLQSRAAVGQSVSLEAEAVALATRGERAASLEKLAAALRLQDEANSVAPANNLKDFQREARLRTAVELGTARPLHEAIAAARGRADSALAEGDALHAAQALREAQAQQIAVNQAFRDTKAARPAAVAGFETEIETLESQSLADRVQAAVAAAERADSAGNASEGGRAWASASALQRELNERFPKSREVSLPRADRFEVNRQTALARPMHTRAAALEAAAANALRRHSIEPALGLLDEAIVLIDRTAQEYPRSAGWDPGLARKVEFLTLKRRDLGEIQEAARRSVIVVPQSPALAIAGGEVSQAFFSRVMHANPSRNRGPALPVESVSWHEAEEFCQRLGWIMGGGVRLLTADEFRLATVGGVIRPVVGRIPSELPGDVAEWLQPGAADGAMAVVASLGQGIPADTAGAISVVPRPKDFRSRTVGFRFVVERAQPEQLALKE